MAVLGGLDAVQLGFAFIDAAIQAFTRLTAQLKIIRRQGWAFSKGDRVADAWGIAAPVFGHDGAARAAIGVAGPINRLTAPMRTQTVANVTEVARELSRDLGWSPASTGTNTTPRRKR